MAAHIDTWEKLVAYFWKNTKKSGKKSCWNYEGCRNPRGYGCIIAKVIGGKNITTHRLSWIIHHGKIPEGLGILHHCDNTSCVNPAHLYPGNQHQNVMDAVRRGRWHTKRGEENNKAILKESQVREILKLKGVKIQTDIAKMFGVSQTTIWAIFNGKLWKHIPR